MNLEPKYKIGNKIKKVKDMVKKKVTVKFPYYRSKKYPKMGTIEQINRFIAATTLNAATTLLLKNIHIIPKYV